MITLPTTWLYPGKTFKKLVRLKGLERDSLLHSFLLCTYPVYQTNKNINDKILYINRLKISLFNHNEDYKKFLMEEDYDNLLKLLSKDFEINIYLMRCTKNDTLIKNTYINSDDSPIIVIESCNIFYPLGVNDVHGIHTMFFEKIDNEFRRSIESFHTSGISDSYEEEVEEEIKIKMDNILKYNVEEVLKSLKHKKLK